VTEQVAKIIPCGHSFWLLNPATPYAQTLAVITAGQMRNLVLYLALFCLSTIAHGQSLEEKISDKLCDCFETIDESLEGVDVLTKFQENCIMQTLKVFASEINNISDTVKNLTDYERGQKFGRLISARTQVIMIERCDQFFYFMDKFRNGVFKTVNKGRSC
jgi:hypothetical protein